MRTPAGALNRSLLLFILFLDLVGFTVIFPLVPELLAHYLAEAERHSAAWPGLLREGLALLPIASHADALIVVLGGGIAALYSWLQFLASPLWGRLSDRIGRRPVLILTSMGLAISHLGWLLAPGFGTFILARLFGGLMAGNMGVASAAMADITPAEARTRAMGMVGAAFGMGFIFGPVIGGLSAGAPLPQLTPWLGHPFTTPALVALALSALSALLNLLFFVETRSGDHRAQWIAHPLQALRERATRPQLGPVLLLNLAFVLVFSAFEFTFTFFFKLRFGLSPREIGFIFLYIGLLLVLGQGGLVRALSKRIGPARMLAAGLVLMPLPALLLAWTAPELSLALLCLAPLALGSSLIQPALASLASLVSAENEQGFNLSLLRSAGSLGRAVGPAIGALLYFYLDVRIAYAVIAALFLATLLAARRLPEPGDAAIDARSAGSR